MTNLPTPAHIDGHPLDSLAGMRWVGDIPALGAARYPERDALIFADRDIHLSYARLDASSEAFADLARAHDLGPGDRIAYLGKNSEFFYIALFGAIRARAVLVAINFRLAAPEVRFQLEDSGARLLICDLDLMPHAIRAVQEMAQPPVLLPIDGPQGLRDTLPTRGRRPAATVAAGSTVDTDPAVATRVGTPAAAPIAASSDGTILQLYTSGTTGRPKGVLISHAALSIARHAELQSPDFAHVSPDCVALSAMPNFHIGGMSWVLIGLVRLGTVVITADPSVANMVKLLRHYDVQHTWLVPTLIRALVDFLRNDPHQVPRLTGMFYGAMPMDVSLLREAMDLFGCSFLQFFGMTEVTGAATALAPVDHDLDRPNLLKSVGRPYPGMSVEIRSPDRRRLNCGEHGEIWVKSPTLMQGYWNLPDRTAESVVDGWFASGDGGYLDDEGYLYLTDRIKDMIVTGGENVYPVEVEQVLRQHPAVLEAAVVGLPDTRWGERVVAVLETRAGAAPSAEELIAFCRRHIADYKCPKQIDVVASLPRTASGKVQRGVVRLSLTAKRD